MNRSTPRYLDGSAGECEDERTCPLIPSMRFTALHSRTIAARAPHCARRPGRRAHACNPRRAKPTATRRGAGESHTTKAIILTDVGVEIRTTCDSRSTRNLYLERRSLKKRARISYNSNSDNHRPRTKETAVATENRRSLQLSPSSQSRARAA